jgi:hypothetical protein
MKRFLFLLCITFIFSCEEELKDGEYYETITIGDNYTTQRVKVIQIDTVFERSGDRYVGGWVNNYYVVGPHGEGTWISRRGGGRKGEFKSGRLDGKVRQFNSEGDTTFKGDYLKNIKHGKGIKTNVSVSRNSWQQYIGDFKFGKKHGKGTWTCSKRRVKEGLWEYGDFLGEETFDVELSKSKVVPQSVQELCVLEIKL